MPIDKLAVLHEEFLERCEAWEAQEDGLPRALRWYLLTGAGMGFSLEDLQRPLADLPQIQGLIAAADADALLAGKPPPRWRRGERCRIDGAEYRIVDLQWNGQAERWDYYYEGPAGRTLMDSEADGRA